MPGYDDAGEFGGGRPVVAEARRGGGMRGLLIALLLAFIAGIALMGFVLARWDRAATLVGVKPASTPQPTSEATLLAPTGATRAGADPATVTALDMRVAELEQRIARVGERAQAASGNAARAEGLLIAFAARRALDRGMALGYIEAQLRERFGAAQPRAVATVIASSRAPVTLEELQIGLDDLAPAISTDGAEGWWPSIQREVAGLVVVRRAGSPSPAPSERLRRAKRMLEGGRVDAALAEVARMPGRDKAGSWMIAARRFNAARQALDVIETSAVLEPKVNEPPPLLPEPIDPLTN